ncbi:RRM-domain-containing protein [Nosema granulosis]|uniref:RRM-domain-containing protein n=1 Tax=Nosema granulosis TaxID=83296 RepID=A0A9P6GYY9_9MICR|nr:RRM-domain-containing protein [Nosema granulosis]
METKRISINQTEIDRRMNIKPFGNLEGIKAVEVTENLEFIVNNNNQVVDTPKKEKPASIYKAPVESEPTTAITNPNIYQPPCMKKQIPTVSVKISNYPLDMSKEELLKLISSHSKVPFSRFHMVRDRETGESRGYSFVTVENKEKASLLIKDLRSVVVDSLRLLGELSKSN